MNPYSIGAKRIKTGMEVDRFEEVNAGISLVEEGRTKLRSARMKLISREAVRDLDENNRLLAIGN